MSLTRWYQSWDGLRAPAVWFDGDSLTYGVCSSGGLTYPQQAVSLLPGPVAWADYGVSGTALHQMVITARFRIDPLSSRLRQRQIVVIWGGTNDMAGAEDGATTAANMQLYCQNRRSAGFKVIALTALPRGPLAGTFEGRRQVFNGLVQANWATYADALADVGSDLTIGQQGQQNGAYYCDTVHLVNAGYAIVAGYVAAALGTLL